MRHSLVSCRGHNSQFRQFFLAETELTGFERSVDWIDQYDALTDEDDDLSGQSEALNSLRSTLGTLEHLLMPYSVKYLDRAPTVIPSLARIQCLSHSIASTIAGPRRLRVCEW